MKGPLVVLLPVRTVSEANAHSHWRERQKRAKAQRDAAGLVVFARLPHVASLTDKSWRLNWKLVGQGVIVSKLKVVDPLLVTLTRIAPRALDDDNLAGSQKHVRDGVADALGIDDRDPRVTWRYAQRRGEAGTYAVEIRIEGRGDLRPAEEAP